jgi:FdhD protein
MLKEKMELPMDTPIKLIEINKITKDNKKPQTDLVIREVMLTIILNRKRLVGLACLPQMHKALAVGFLFSEGLVTELAKIESLKQSKPDKIVEIIAQIPESRLKNFIDTGEKTPGCGSSLSGSLRNISQQNFVDFKPKNIFTAMNKFQEKAELFRQTGGVHSAALVQADNLQVFADDIGRHNAVDKVIGAALLNNITIIGKTMLVSGRISSEIMKKAIRLQLCTLASHSAPTSKAVDLAWQYGITLIGFARGKRFNLYTNFSD